VDILHDNPSTSTLPDAFYNIITVGEHLLSPFMCKGCNQGQISAVLAMDKKRCSQSAQLVCMGYGESSRCSSPHFSKDLVSIIGPEK
jgi:hypothetical protein